MHVVYPINWLANNVWRQNDNNRRANTLRHTLASLARIFIGRTRSFCYSSGWLFVNGILSCHPSGWSDSDTTIAAPKTQNAASRKIEKRHVIPSNWCKTHGLFFDTTHNQQPTRKGKTTTVNIVLLRIGINVKLSNMSIKLQCARIHDTLSFHCSWKIKLFQFDWFDVLLFYVHRRCVV